MNKILNYVDYREFIREFYQIKKAENPGYSLKVLSEKTGFKARDYLLRVMNGTRNLSELGINALASAFKFSGKERLYFEHLVRFNQAKTPESKNHHFQILLDLRKGCDVEKITEDQYEYFCKWYNVAMRSLITVFDYKDNFEEIAKTFDPPITPRQAKQSVELLLKLGMLNKDESGQYKVTSPLVTSGEDVKTVGLTEFHKSVLQLALRSLDLHQSSSRDISGVTLSLSSRAFENIKEEIAQFRKKVMNIAHQDSNEEAVFQLNIQFFPLTRQRNKK